MYYLVLRRYYIPKCSKISKKSAKNSGNHSSKKIYEERVICQDIAVFFSKVKKKIFQHFLKFFELRRSFKGPSWAVMEKFHKNIDFFAFEANSTMSCQITLFAKIFFQEKAKEKVISRIFCTFLRIIEHFGSSNTIEKQESVCMCCWISKRCLIALSIPEADLCFSSRSVSIASIQDAHEVDTSMDTHRSKWRWGWLGILQSYRADLLAFGKARIDFWQRDRNENCHAGAWWSLPRAKKIGVISFGLFGDPSIPNKLMYVSEWLRIFAAEWVWGCCHRRRMTGRRPAARRSVWGPTFQPAWAGHDLDGLA